jgi:predicted TIM-barrel fold metal-dependent hydrolase
VARWLAASKIIVIHGRQIVVNQRIRMNHLNRRRESHRLLRKIVAEKTARHEQQARANSLAAGQRAVARSLPNRIVLSVRWSEKMRQSAFKLNKFAFDFTLHVGCHQLGVLHNI